MFLLDIRNLMPFWTEQLAKNTLAIWALQLITNKDKLRYVVGIGANVGCGVEYQITDKYRVFLDQQISIGVMSCWMAKIGGAYCF